MPLDGVRVLEAGFLPAGAYLARLMADLGAEVVKIGPPDCDPMERQAPLAGAAPDAPGAAWAFLAAGKRRVTLRDGDPDDMATLERLVAGADVLVTSDGAPGPAADVTALAKKYPGLVICDVSWFGRSGPYAGWRGSDAVCRALAGVVENVGPVEGPPLAGPEFQALVTAGVSGFIGVMAALCGRARHGGGQALELSVFEACIAHAEFQCADGWLRGAGFPRGGVNRFAPTYPLGVYTAADGWVGVTIVTPAQWQAFCDMLDISHYAARADLATGEARLAIAGELDAIFNERFAQRTKEAWFAEALKRRLPVTPVWTMDELAAMEHLRDSGAIAGLEIGGRVALAPGCPLRLTKTPPRRRARLEAPGPAPAWEPRPAGRAASRPPLEGVTVVDLSMGWAGPLCGRFLADLGAVVIKVEACRYPDWWRGVDYGEEALRERLYEKSARFCAMNRNKRGVTLDLTHPDGVAALKRLVARADVVVENYAADVLPRLGLDYAALSAVNPRLVMTSMSAFGAASPWREARAYGSTLEQASGLPTITGAPDGPPVMSHIAYGDATGGLNGAAATLAALFHQLRAGEGQHVDISQTLCMMPMTAPAMVARSLGGEAPRTGNRHPAHAPHGCYACQPDREPRAWTVEGAPMPAAAAPQPEPGEGWLVISVTDDAMWRALARCIGRDDLAADPQLASAAGRKAREDELDAAVAAWCAARPAGEAMRLLQQAGVAAGVARPALDLFNDPHLAARRYWRIARRDWTGDLPHAATPFRPAGGAGAPPVRFPAPTLGQHTREALRDVAGMPEAEIDALFASGVSGHEALPPRPRRMAAE